MEEETTTATTYPQSEQQRHQLDVPRYRLLWRYYGSTDKEEDNEDEDVDKSELSSSPCSSSSSEERLHQVKHHELAKNYDGQDCDEDITNDTTTTTTATTVTYIGLLRTNTALR